MMQKFLIKLNEDTLSIIIEILSNAFDKIIVDIYGNYFCQKLIQSCNNEQKIEILKCVKIKIKLFFFNLLIIIFYIIL
jgi:hypothetical protein